MFWRKRDDEINRLNETIERLKAEVKSAQDDYRRMSDNHYQRALDSVKRDLTYQFSQLASERQDLHSEQVFWQATKDTYVLEKLKEIGR